MPLLEQYLMEGDSLYNNSNESKILDEKSCLTLLVKSRGKRNKLEVLKLIKVLNDRQYFHLVKNLKKHKNIDIKYAATQVLKHLSQN